MTSARLARIVSSAHDISDARLHRWAQAFQASGWHTDIVAVGDRERAPVGARVTTLRRSRGDRVFRAWSLVRDPCDALVVLDPELAITALLVGRKQRGLLVVDVHEDYAAVASDRQWARGPMRSAIRAGARVAGWAASKADISVVADHHVPPMRARRREVVRNLPANGEIPDAGPPDDTPVALYIGSITPSRGLHSMVEAVAAAPPWRLELIGPIDPEAEEWALRVGDDRVAVHGQLDPKASWERARGAWVGLALLDGTPAYRAAMPTKVYEYLAAGIPVLASKLPRVEALLEESGGGVTVDSPAAAATTLRRWVEDATELAEMRSAARRWRSRNLPDDSPFEHFVRQLSGMVKR